MQKGVDFQVQDEGPRSDALLPRPGGLAKAKRDFPFPRKIHCEAAKEKQDGGMQVCVYSDGTQLQKAMWKCCWAGIGKPIRVLTTCGGLNVLGKLPTRHMLYCEYFESIYG